MPIAAHCTHSHLQLGSRYQLVHDDHITSEDFDIFLEIISSLNIIWIVSCELIENVVRVVSGKVRKGH